MVVLRVLLPLLIVFAVAIALVVLILAHRDTRYLQHGQQSVTLFPSTRHPIGSTFSSKKVTKAGLIPAIARAPNLAAPLPLKPMPACPALLNITPAAVVAIPVHSVLSPK